MKTVYLVVFTVILSSAGILAYPRTETEDFKDELSIDEGNDDKPEEINFDAKSDVAKGLLDEDSDEKVSYKGYQLWKLKLDNQNKSRVVSSLRKKNGKKSICHLKFCFVFSNYIIMHWDEGNGYLQLLN